MVEDYSDDTCPGSRNSSHSLTDRWEQWSLELPSSGNSHFLHEEDKSMDDDADRVFEDDENENDDKTNNHRYVHLKSNCCRCN